MTESDPAFPVLEVLAEELPPSIARSVVTTTMRRELGDVTFSGAQIPLLVTALERTLPMFIVDPERRRRCVSKLRSITPAELPLSSNGARPPSPSQPDDVVVAILSADDLGKACDASRELADKLGFSQLEQTKIATAVSELARNIVLYAGRGEVRLRIIGSPKRGLEVVATDRGPGIRDVGLVMSAAYRSRTGMGMGLKGARRLMDAFDVTSAPGSGTTVVARRFVG